MGRRGASGKPFDRLADARIDVLPCRYQAGERADRIDSVTAPLDHLRALVSADETLRTELAAAADADSFLAAAAAIARRNDCAAEPANFASLTAPDPLGLLRLESPSLLRREWPPCGWLPYQLSTHSDGSLAVDWADFSGLALDGRFFASVTRQALARPLNRLLRCRTGLDDFLRGPPEGLRPPDGFIFHMSRCGSTLTARLLAALPDTDLISEAEPLDAMVHLSRDARAPDEWRAMALRTMVAALGRRPSRRWFVKLNAWHALALPLFRLAFPDTPWLFLYRDPAQILASQMAERGTELTPEIVPPLLYGMPDGAALPGEVYCARVLAALAEAALAADGGLMVDHAALPHALSAILAHFGIESNQAESRPLREIALRDAKRPDAAYRPGGAAVMPAIRAAADAWLAPLHARLLAVHGRESLL
jgi:hypothetical protein